MFKGQERIKVRSTKFLCCTLFFLLFILEGCCQHHIKRAACPEPLPGYYVPDNIRVAVVLGSGGVRGVAHLGALEVLEEAGIPIDLIVGCSAGSIVGAFYAETPCVRKIIKPVWSLRSTTLLDLDLWNCRYGLSQGRSMLRILDDDLNAEKFEDLKIPLVVVASDLYSGELVTIGSGDISEGVRASCSIPFVFVPCEYKGRVLVDGGVVNPVPAKVAKDLGAEVIIAIDLCELLDQTLPTNLVEITTRSAEIAFMWQNQACSKDADVVIRPKTCDIGTFCDDKKSVLYEAGKKAARDQLPEIMTALQSIPAEKWCRPSKRKYVNALCYSPEIYLNDEDYNPKTKEEGSQKPEVRSQQETESFNYNSPYSIQNPSHPEIGYWNSVVNQ